MKNNIATITTLSLAGITACTGLVLTSSYVSAEDVVDNVSIEVPVSCTMSGSGMNTHTSEIANGTYTANIGTTTMNVLCNDNGGFSIYSVGFTGDTIGQTNSNKLVGTSASGNAAIDTGTATTAGNPDVSNWAMKLATDSQATYPITILSDSNEQSFASYHAVPNEYTKVATRLTGTDTGTGAVGSTLTTTYAAYISKTQPADTYSGKVKYTLVHPNDATPSNVPVLTPTVTCTTQVPGAAYMQDINASNKATILEGMTEDAEYFLRDARDNKDYCVAKLKDGNLWMTQNLDFDIDSTKTYTSQDTDIPTNWTPAVSTHATSDTEWNAYDEDTNPDGGDDIHAESYDPGDLYWNGYVRDEFENETECTAAGGIWNGWKCDLGDYTASTGNSHHHLGNYYNWTAAVATNDSSVYGVFNDETGEYENQDANQSICPANWTLPKVGDDVTSRSFEYLVTEYGWGENSYYGMSDPYIWETPIKTALASVWYGSSLYLVGGDGVYWSSTAFEENDAYNLVTNNYGNVDPYNVWYRNTGYSVRCLAR